MAARARETAGAAGGEGDSNRGRQWIRKERGRE